MCWIVHSFHEPGVPLGSVLAPLPYVPQQRTYLDFQSKATAYDFQLLVFFVPSTDYVTCVYMNRIIINKKRQIENCRRELVHACT